MESGFGTASKCDHSTSITHYLNSVQYNSSWNFICEHLLVKCVVSCGKMIPLS